LSSQGEYRQKQLRGRKDLGVGSIAQLPIQNEALGGDKMGNTLFKQQRDRIMDLRLCGLGDCWSKNAS
jgi:hypothetical protein